MTPPSSSNTPYYAVIFTATRNTQHDARYGEMAGKMVALATTMPGYIGIEGGTVSPKSGITVSYWDSEAAIANWKKNMEHLVAQEAGKETFFEEYRIRVAKVEREYAWDAKDGYKKL